jgi:hypothetical protein
MGSLKAGPRVINRGSCSLRGDGDRNEQDAKICTIRKPDRTCLARPRSEAAGYNVHMQDAGSAVRRKKECSMQVVSERQTDSFARDGIKITKQIGGAIERGRLRGDAHVRWPDVFRVRVRLYWHESHQGGEFKNRKDAKRVNLNNLISSRFQKLSHFA